MRVKMKTTAAGPAGVFQADQEVVIPDELGQSFIEGDYAVEVKKPSPAAKASKPERPKKRGRSKATQKPPETATIPEADEA